MITDDPLRIEVGDVEMYIDLDAEQVLAAEREGEKIAVEIKSFIGTSNISQFHEAIGQFFNYHLALEEQQPQRVKKCRACSQPPRALIPNITGKVFLRERIAAITPMLPMPRHDDREL